MLFGQVQFNFEDDLKPVCQKYSYAKIYPPIAPKRRGGPCLINIGDTPDLGEGEGDFGTLVFSFRHFPFDTILSALGPRPINWITRVNDIDTSTIPYWHVPDSMGLWGGEVGLEKHIKLKKIKKIPTEIGPLSYLLFVKEVFLYRIYLYLIEGCKMGILSMHA